ncbi:hypothetical protein ABZ615_27460 [Streptomyces sp. NPDC007325]|uniref:hypothetical protein n=1 Tax=Streptomyces sp. NPDC007325 TaxID=3154588 RepID=UPI0033EBAFD7
MLFLALVYFAVGQAAVLRNAAQTAADAAALGAAYDARDQLRDGWVGVISDPDQWQLFVEGKALVDSDVACQRAVDLAADNDADVDECSLAGLGFQVAVHTRETVGESVVPDTATHQAIATAQAVIEPRCSFSPPGPPADPEPTTEPSPTSSAEPEPEPETEPILGLVCDGEALAIDPEEPVLPEADLLFHVRLTGDNQ